MRRQDFDTVVIVDEIQESAEIYNRIREFTWSLESDFIVTGSYLGRILNKEFRYSAGDMVSIEIRTLSFEEFLDASGKLEMFSGLDIFGAGEEAVRAAVSQTGLIRFRSMRFQNLSFPTTPNLNTPEKHDMKILPFCAGNSS